MSTESIIIEEVNKRVKEELLNGIDEDTIDRITLNIIERVYPGSTLSGTQVPAFVDGRDVRITDRLLSVGDAQDINGFYSLMKEAIDDRLSRENIADRDKVKWTHEYPFDESRSEVITYKLISRCPGTTSQGKQMNKRRQDWRPKFRETLDDPDHTNKKLFVYGQVYDNLVELCCWAQTNKTADARALWLESLVDEYKWFIKYKGIAEVRYQERLADTFKAIGDNEWHGRPLRYFVSTEKITRYSQFVVRDLVVKLIARTTSLLGE